MVEAQEIAEELKTYEGCTARVIDQNERKVVYGDSVPASENISLSLNLTPTATSKDHRDTFNGHKLCLTGGASNLITDCVICDGNTVDSTMTNQMLDRQCDRYGRCPLKVDLEGGFGSQENLNSAKSKRIKDACFAKKHRLNLRRCVSAHGLLTAPEISRWREAWYFLA